MNTWIISPNWLAWTLLGIAAASLLIIALCSNILTVRGRRTRRDVTNNSIRNHNVIEKVASSTNWIIYIWFTIGIIVLIFVTFDFNNGIKLRAQEASVSTILSILVTFLVAWQIWQSIASKEEIREAHKAAENLEATKAELNKRIDEIRWLAVGFYNEHQQEKSMTPSNKFWHIARTAGAYVAANVPTDFRPLPDALQEMIALLQSLEIMDADNADERKRKLIEITKLGGTRKQDLDEWQERITTLIETEMKHLKSIQHQVREIHHKYYSLTRYVKIKQQV